MDAETRTSKLLQRTNALVAALLAIAGVFLLLKTEGQDMTIMFSLILFVAAAAFLLSYFASAHQWRTQCYLQMVGPAIVVFALFGGIVAVVAASIGMIICLVRSNRARHGRGAA